MNSYQFRPTPCLLIMSHILLPFGTNSSCSWCLEFVPSSLSTVLILVQVIPLLQCSALTSSYLWDLNCNKSTAHKLRPSPTSEQTLSFRSQELNPSLDKCHLYIVCEVWWLEVWDMCKGYYILVHLWWQPQIAFCIPECFSAQWGPLPLFCPVWHGCYP